MAEENSERLSGMCPDNPNSPEAPDEGDSDDAWVSVTDDGGVRKCTIKAGAGAKPDLHSVCLGG